jgi:hypothetical protein
MAERTASFGQQEILVPRRLTKGELIYVAKRISLAEASPSARKTTNLQDQKMARLVYANLRSDPRWKSRFRKRSGIMKFSILLATSVCIASAQVSVLVLVQREMESWRSQLASITPFSTGQFGPYGQCSGWLLWTRWAAETATGFGKKSRWVVPKFTQGARTQKRAWLGKGINQARTGRHRHRQGESCGRRFQEDRRTVSARSPPAPPWMPG